jgi:hypothetical protein
VDLARRRPARAHVAGIHGTASAAGALMATGTRRPVTASTPERQNVLDVDDRARRDRTVARPRRRTAASHWRQQAGEQKR